jgi:hypothetical protein
MELSELQGDGASLRTHLQRLAANTGRVDERLDTPGVPPCAGALWGLWAGLTQTRQSGMGPSPITHQEIAAACGLYGVQLNPWEVETVLQLDGVVMRHAAAQSAKTAHARKNA